MDKIKNFLESNDFKESLCIMINKNIDIPLINETSEGVVIRSIVSIINAIVKENDLTNIKSLDSVRSQYLFWCD